MNDHNVFDSQYSTKEGNAIALKKTGVQVQ